MRRPVETATNTGHSNALKLLKLNGSYRPKRDSEACLCVIRDYHFRLLKVVRYLGKIICGQIRNDTKVSVDRRENRQLSNFTTPTLPHQICQQNQYQSSDA